MKVVCTPLVHLIMLGSHVHWREAPFDLVSKYFLLCLQFAHRRCIQRWCNEKGNTICEICKQVCCLLLHTSGFQAWFLVFYYNFSQIVHFWFIPTRFLFSNVVSCFLLQYFANCAFLYLFGSFLLEEQWCFSFIFVWMWGFSNSSLVIQHHLLCFTMAVFQWTSGISFYLLKYKCFHLRYY